MAYLDSTGKCVKLAWVKAHCGVRHNEIVDKLAKKALLLSTTANYKCVPEDIIIHLKYQIKTEWQTIYDTSHKGQYYKQLQSSIPLYPWFKDSFLGKEIIRNICRLRFNHTLVPSHLFKINLTNTPYCECGEEGTAEHMILNCYKHSEKIEHFIKQLNSNTELQRPFNLTQLLVSKNSEIYKSIHHHIGNIGLKL